MFGSIATGIAGAWLLVNNNHILGIIFNKFVQAACWLVLLCSILFSFFIPYVHYEVMACVCLVLILNVTSNKNTLLSLESKFLDKTGAISYGIYMIHWPLIPVIVYVIKELGLWSFFIQTKQIPLLIISFGLTWLLADLSFRYFESFFLRLKPGKKSMRVQQAG